MDCVASEGTFREILEAETSCCLHSDFTGGRKQVSTGELFLEYIIFDCFYILFCNNGLDVLKQISEVRHLFLDSGFVVVCVSPSWWAVSPHLPLLHCSMLCDLEAAPKPLSFLLPWNA